VSGASSGWGGGDRAGHVMSTDKSISAGRHAEKKQSGDIYRLERGDSKLTHWQQCVESIDYLQRKLSNWI